MTVWLRPAAFLQTPGSLKAGRQRGLYCHVVLSESVLWAEVQLGACSRGCGKAGQQCAAAPVIYQ